MYAEGFTVSRCLAATDMSLGTFYYWLDGGPVVEDGDAVPSAVDGRIKSGHDAEIAEGEVYGPDDTIAQTRMLPPIPRRRVVVGKRRVPLRTDRVSLTARAWRTVERQMRDIEERLARPARSGPERERDIRMFGSLTRTLRDLDAFARSTAATPDAPPAPSSDDEPPQDIEAFREELTRRIYGIIADHDAEQAALAPGDGRS
jgi:hypothetical protein